MQSVAPIASLGRSFFYRTYLKITDALVFAPLLSLFGVGAKRIEAFHHSTWKNVPEVPRGTRTQWFHAASTGELEILIPLIQEFMQKGLAVGVSVFSESAIPFLSKLPDGLLYSGFSPRESEWEDLLHHYNVGRVIVSKYEAWPALWAAASEQHAPLVVINAQTRSSLTWVKRFLKWFHVPLPHLFFSCVGPEQQNEVQVQFPTATVLVHSDPRWVRAISRAKIARENGAVQSILTELSSEKQKPYCLVGSAWLADLKKIAPAFQKIPGTLWVVPHSLKAEGLAEMEAYLAAMLPGRYELVARMGVLLELYSLADCAWVGGGFGEGIHSTLEPAVFQIPIACGPKNVEKFLETRELRDAQMLTVCRSTEEIQAWLQKSMQMNGVKKTEHDLLSPENKLRDFEQLVDDCLRTV